MDENISDKEDMIQMEEEEENNGNDSDDEKRFNDFSEGGFISSFCQIEGNDFFVEIDEEFFETKSNLFGISKYFKNYEYLLSIIMSEDPIDEGNNYEIKENINQIKELYGLIHSRFIVSPKGLALVREKYLNGVFGICPRILCNKQTVLPIGLSEDTKYSRVKIFCPRCEEIYSTKHKYSNMDGAYFGTYFPQTYPDLIPFTNNSPNPDFIPKLYGFKIYKKKGSKYFSRPLL